MIGGVDDSDGTIGELIGALCEVLKKFALFDPQCKKTFKKLDGTETIFGRDESLI